MSILIVYFFLFFSGQGSQVSFFEPGRLYDISKINGRDSDLKTLFFMIKQDDHIPSSLALKYDDRLMQVRFYSDTLLIAYYNVERNGNNIHIDNFNPLRNRVSYNDSRERNYKLAIEKGGEGELILKFWNFGKINKLKRSITFKARLKE